MIAVPNEGVRLRGEMECCGGEGVCDWVDLVGVGDTGGLWNFMFEPNSTIEEGVVASMSVVESLSVSRWISIVGWGTGACWMSSMAWDFEMDSEGS